MILLILRRIRSKFPSHRRTTVRRKKLRWSWIKSGESVFSVYILKVRQFQNVFMKLSFLPKYEQKIVKISALTTQGRNPDSFLFVFWEKWWLHKCILKFTPPPLPRPPERRFSLCVPFILQLILAKCYDNLVRTCHVNLKPSLCVIICANIDRIIASKVSMTYLGGSFNNYIDKKRGGGRVMRQRGDSKMSFFVHSRGRGSNWSKLVKIGQNLVCTCWMTP